MERQTAHEFDLVLMTDDLTVGSRLTRSRLGSPGVRRFLNQGIRLDMMAS